MDRRRLAAPFVLLLLTASMQAARPQSWTFSSQKDFAEGRFVNVVVNSYGELSLGRPLTPVPLEHAGENISAFAQSGDGSVYVATSPEAAIYKIENHKATLVYKAPKGFDDITAMIADGQGNLLVALAGESAKLISLNPAEENPQPATRFQVADVSYIWSIARAPDGAIFLGTGPHGKIYRLAGGGAEPAVYLDTPQKNITALAFDKPGNLIAGTDAHGLVLRVDAQSKKPFVILDAGKVDINALTTDAAGNVYVATAKTELSDNSNGPSMDEEMKGKPSEPEGEPVAPPQEESAKPGALGPIPSAFHPILGAVPSDLPPDLKALLKKAAGNAAQHEGKGGKGRAQTLPSHRSKGHSRLPRMEEPEAEADGVSSVIRISPDGLATTLVQDQGNNYSLLFENDHLLIGTGDEGKLFSFTPADQSLSLISRVKEQQVSTLFADKQGNVLVGTGNMAQVYEMPPTAATTGSFTSQVLDASHHANFGHALADTILPAGAKVTIATRSGNTHDLPANAAFWSEWTDVGEGAKVTSPGARFLQVRITLTTDKAGSGTGEAGTAPTLSNLRLAYQTDNLAPRLRNVTVELPGGDPSDASADPDMSSGSDDSDKLAHVSWDAADPNGDSLVARLYYRPVTGDGAEPWTLFARDQKDTPYDWDTKSMPDGKYQVKVVVSDSPDNPAARALEAARTSATVAIDHTPPVLADLAATVEGNKATVTGSAKDGLSAVTDVRFQVDGQNSVQGGAEDWQPGTASDKIFDSPQEAFTLVTRPLSAGVHRITVRATDASGNSSYKAVTINVKP